MRRKHLGSTLVAVAVAALEHRADDMAVLLVRHVCDCSNAGAQRLMTESRQLTKSKCFYGYSGIGRSSGMKDCEVGK